MNKWIKASRLRTLPLALATIGMGSFLAAYEGKFEPLIFALCLLTTIALQILSNLANDYGDSIHGADSVERVGPSRQVQTGGISLAHMRTAVAVMILICLITGISLLYISAAILYTNGKKPYGYIGLGDISVFLFFGLLGVAGTKFLMTKSFVWDDLLAGAACGFFTVAVLNVNNVRDIESDKLAGKYSIPVRLGRNNSGIYHGVLLLAGILCAVAYNLINYLNITQFAFLLIIPLLLKNYKAVKGISLTLLDPYLKQMALTTLLFVLLFGLGLVF